MTLNWYTSIGPKNFKMIGSIKDVCWYFEAVEILCFDNSRS